MRFTSNHVSAVCDAHGLVTLDSWLAAGLGRSSFYRALASGPLMPVAPGVGVLLGTDVTTLVRIAAGIRAFGPGVMASHCSSAWLRGAPVVGDAPVELLTADRNRRARHEGYVLHRPVDSVPRHATHCHGLPSTSPLRTLLDLGASTAVTPTLEHFVRHGLVTLPALRRSLERHRRRGRPGVRALERAVDALASDGVVTDSELETVMRRIFREAGLAHWELHPKLEGYVVDFCFRTERLVVEVDGWAFHSRLIDRENGCERDLTLVAAGWVVAHVTWRMVRQNPEAAVARLRSALAHRSRDAESRR